MSAGCVTSSMHTYGTVWVKHLEDAEARASACVKWLREQKWELRSLPVPDVLAIHRQILAGNDYSLGKKNRNDYVGIASGDIPGCYLVTFEEDPPYQEANWRVQPDFGENQLLLVNGAAGDADAAIEFCALLLRGDIPLPYYPAYG